MMQQKKRETGIGTLPAMAPLANPYVPFQADDPARYETGIGLVRGTIYPGLDLYRRYQQMYREMATEYAKQRGPLNHYDPDDDSTYRWLSDPWPWEYCMNKEG